MNRNKGIRRLSLFIISMTFTVLACQGVAGFSPFATATPTATATFTPTPTLTVTPSPTATATQTPTATPRPTGVVIQEQTEGGPLVIDYDNGYRLLLPPDWEVLFSTQEDLVQAIDLVSKQSPQYAQVVRSFRDVDPDIFRLAAINTDRKYADTKFPSVLTVNAFADPIGSKMPMAFVTAMIEDNIFAGAPSTTWDVIDNINKVEVGTVQGIKTAALPNGVRVTVAELVIAFQANEKLMIMEIATPKEFSEEVLGPFDEIIDSIKLDN